MVRIDAQCGAEINIYEVYERLLDITMKDLITKVDIRKYPDLSNYMNLNNLKTYTVQCCVGS